MPGKIKVTCPNGHKLAAEERKAGKTVACPVCGVKLTIPVPEDRKCTDSAVLRILGIGDELLKATRGEKTKYDFPPEGSDLLLGAHPSKKQRNTQICPQCDWEIDAGYTVCPHCHFYLSGSAKNGGKG